jgi:voltage-dependent potassium channel beta subunit
MKINGKPWVLGLNLKKNKIGEKMHYRRLGNTGIKVSELSLGSWVTFGNQIDEKTAVNILHAAYDHGINFFDNADTYVDGKSETVMGHAIKGLPREALVISSKVFYPTMPGVNGRGLSRKHITESIHASLKRLNLDYVDLYYCHRFDPDTTVEEVVQSMDILVRQGKVLYWGTSCWEPYQITQAILFARQSNLIAPVVEQPRYSLFAREDVEAKLSPICKEFGIGLTTFSPLYYGALTGKYNDGIPQGSRLAREDMAWIRERVTPDIIAKVKQLMPIAQDLGMTPAQMALAWLLRRKEVSSVITGATRVEQLDENLLAADATAKLTDSVLEKIEQVVKNSPI